MTEIETVDWDAMSRGELQAMLAAGEKVLECVRVLGNTTDNIVGELLRDGDGFFEWNHYPDGDVYDHKSHAQFYYHAHPKDERPGEHGHFHTFLRPKGMPPGIEPAPLDDYEPPDDDNGALSHLIAISMDKRGVPLKLFSTNRWVTGEVWYKAEDVCRLVNYFVIDHVRPYWAVNLWISSMMVLFRPQIRALIRARDVAVDSWAADHPGENVYEDRELEVTAEYDISVPDQMMAIRAALKQKKAA